MDMVWIGVGAAVGANARYYVGQWVGSWLGVSFPNGTLIVNATGSFLIGVIATLLGERLLVDPHWRLLLVVGLLGGYTTVSSFCLQTLNLAFDGERRVAALYVVASGGLCVIAAAVGFGSVVAFFG